MPRGALLSLHNYNAQLKEIPEIQKKQYSVTNKTYNKDACNNDEQDCRRLFTCRYLSISNYQTLRLARMCLYIRAKQ